VRHLGREVRQSVMRRSPLCPDRCHERFGTDDVHHPRQILSEHGERHLGGDPRQDLSQEVRRAQSRLHPMASRAQSSASPLKADSHQWHRFTSEVPISDVKENALTRNRRLLARSGIEPG